MSEFLRVKEIFPMDGMTRKIKCKHRKNKYIITAILSQNAVINEKQYDVLRHNTKYGFCDLKKINKNKLIYESSNSVTLYERLKKSITEYDFFFIVEQLVDILQKLEKIGLSYNNIVLDLKCVFFNEPTKELSFVYLPIATPHNGIGFLTFVEQIIYSVKPFGDGTKYLSNFSYFMKKFNEFEADKVEAYIWHVNSDIVKIIKSVDLKEKVNNINVEKYTEILDDEPTDLMTDDIEQDLMNEDDEKTELFNDDEATELFSDDKTELFDESKATSCRFPTLIRTLTDEVIRINKPVFRIGKEENCVDYIVTNNSAISRSHADIISRDGRYFVFDLRSKNKSYINNRVLPVEREVEINNGDVLKLADEEFLFQV